MHIPKGKNLGTWAAELVDQCSASRKERIQRGALFRNLYLTGDPNGDPAVYNKTNAHIDNLQSFLYSPVELRFVVEAERWADAAARAKCKAASSELARWVRECDIDMLMEPAVEWSLVKGKTFVKLLWQEGQFVPFLIQPEFMAVLREDLGTLDKQEAFVQSTYLTVYDFERLIATHPARERLMKRVKSFVGKQKDGDAPDQAGYLKQIVLGGTNPYQAAGTNTGTRQRSVVDWITGPKPVFDPRVLENLIRLDELWIKDSDREDDYTTIQIIGDVVIWGDRQQTNLFADMADANPKVQKESLNPLKGHHPYIEFCPNPIDGYFWGRPELCNTALLQECLNARVNGINRLLRIQEDPPTTVTGSTSANQITISRLRKPGGWWADSSPTAKIEVQKPEIPQGLYESLREILEWFNDMAGFTPTMAGRGESGVRSQAHSETLVRTSSPRFKDRAILVERAVEAVGGLMLLMLKAHDADKLIAWVGPKDKSLETEASKADNIVEFQPPPVEGMLPIEFQWWHIPKSARVRVDSHSSSPAFSHEARGLLFDLAKVGAVTPADLIEHLQPTGAESLINAFERREAEKARFMAEHPELALKEGKGGKRR